MRMIAHLRYRCIVTAKYVSRMEYGQPLPSGISIVSVGLISFLFLSEIQIVDEVNEGYPYSSLFMAKLLFC